MTTQEIDALLRDAGWDIRSSRIINDAMMPWYEVSLKSGNQAQVQAPNAWDAFQNANRQLRDNEEYLKRIDQ